MSKILLDAELRHTIIKNQADALVSLLKQFRSYIGYNKIIAHVPYPIVKDVIIQ